MSITCLSRAPAAAEPDVDADAPVGTAAQLLDAAERLSAERGIDSVSLREIVRASGQSNLSAAHYHFGSREHLIGELLARRIRAINVIRHRRLDALEREGQGAQVHAIVSATVNALGDAVRSQPWGPDYVRVAAQVTENRNFKRHRTPQEWACKSSRPSPQRAEVRKTGRIRRAVRASGGSGLASWRVFERSRRARLDPGLRVDPDVGHGLPTRRAAPPRLQGSRSSWR